MKNNPTDFNVKQELMSLKRNIEITENKIKFTNEPKLIDSLSFELLSLRSRMGYLIDMAKQM